MKETFEFEKFFKILDFKKATDLCRFRTTNHKLPIEQGRWNNTDRNNRICTLCAEMMLEMSSIISYNVNILNVIVKHVSSYYAQNTNILKFWNLKTSKNRSELIELCKFIQIINKAVCTPVWVKYVTFFFPYTAYFIVALFSIHCYFQIFCTHCIYCTVFLYTIVLYSLLRNYIETLVLAMKH